MTRPPIRDAARGHWKGILGGLGVGSQYLSGKNTSCPICRDRKPRFRFTDHNGDGMWVCTKCGAHDGFTLLMMLNGWDFRRAAEAVEGIVGKVEPDRQKPKRTEAQSKRVLADLWRAAKPIESVDPAGRYLVRRTGLNTFPPVLRLVRDSIWTRSWPAMLAKVVDGEGRGAQLHRTLLTDEGQKAPVDQPRMMMPGATPPGVAVRLFDHDDHLGIAEGIETALSAASLFSVPCWAALNAGNLKLWSPPPGVRKVTIFADNDASLTGQSAAYALGHRLRGIDLDVEVMIPPDVETDWNDVLNEREVAA